MIDGALIWFKAELSWRTEFVLQQSSGLLSVCLTLLIQLQLPTNGGLINPLRLRCDLQAPQHGKLPAPSSTDGDHPAKDTAGAASGLQRELFTKKGGGRRFSWGRRKEQEQQQQAECAVCLEEFRAGDVLAHLPCAHRFHWACAVPWVQAAARCPFCRAAVPLADHQHV
ncbi:hypothetical protein ZWY2020_023254 [Hordeum vulgare]|nr:hypothetical protein ZWY2020_023254 [Hordeum vulgare]